MIQQINLYQGKFNTAKLPILNPYLLITLTSALVMLLFSALSLNSLYANQSRQIKLRAELQEVQARLQLIQAQNPNQQIDSVLNQELQQTQSYYQNLSRTLEMLADTQSDRSQGFSRYLSTLADQADHNVWLTHIQFNSETNSIKLEGSSYKAEQIPLLLERLQRTNIFKGRHFATLNIDQAPENSDQINFSVSSAVNPETEENHAGKP